ncbi:MFS general substrate transporter [Aspergillus stella-maris]|uniref:MFS general substrate transporter n=1 Tax=Aspergillus stella-maris TaxID=1810926 RepID=UPI003CCCABB6
MAHSGSYTTRPWGYGWRTSKLFITIVISVAMFTDYFLFSFIIPILPDILEDRLNLHPQRIQLFTSIILSMNAIVSILIAPLVGSLSDRVKWKSRLMLLAYLVDVLGTGITAWSTTIAGLLIGRLIQTISGSLLWIAGMAILGGSMEHNQLARAMSICVLFASGGLLSGPGVSAALFNSISYSLTWLSAFLILIVAATFQLLLLEPYNFPPHVKNDHQDSIAQNHEEQSETNSLLSHGHITPFPGEDWESSPGPTASSSRIYWMMLCKRRVLSAVIGEMLLAMLISSFEATIPLHIKKVFHWESLQAGILFLLLQAPSLILAFPAGWLKDYYGMHVPVTVGFLLMAPSLWLLGVPGSGIFAWADHRSGQIIYIVTLVSIGVCRTLVLGLGGVEVMRGATELAADYPGIFGAQTGHSRGFVLSNITFKLGMFLGPLVSGFLTESIGYYFMNVIFGEFVVP